MRLLPASIRARILGVFALSLAALTGALGYGLVQLRAVGDGVATINAASVPLTASARSGARAVRSATAWIRPSTNAEVMNTSRATTGSITLDPTR